MGFWTKFKDKVEKNKAEKVLKQKEKRLANQDKTAVKNDKELAKLAKQKAKEQKAEQVLAKSALTFSKDIQKLSKKYKSADDDFFEELEEVLIQTDMGMKLVLEISKNLAKKVKPNWSFDQVKEALVEEIINLYDEGKKASAINFQDDRLNIFMVVGVNGTGKTTSLAKLAAYYADQGKKVLIAAGDTFRAGAVEQLEEWVGSRLNGVDLYKAPQKNADPASVVFGAIEFANANGYDLLLIDTAGRLQNKVNLMNELEKMHRVVHKFDKQAPHEVLLVIDATTGQNGVVQATAFNEATNVSGIILTKMDGTSKGGIALAIKDQLNIPVKLMGVGEQIEDLVPFDVDEYVYGLTFGFMEKED